MDKGVGRFVNRARSQDAAMDPAPAPGGRDSSLARHLSRRRDPAHHERERERERERMAESLRMPVPQAMYETTHSPTLDDLASLASQKSPSIVHNQHNEKRRGAFDDTDYEDTTTVSSFEEPQAQQLANFGTDYNRQSDELLNVVGAEHYAQQYGEALVDPSSREVPYGTHWAPSIFEEIREARKTFAPKSTQPQTPQVADGRELEADDDDDEVARQDDHFPAAPSSSRPRQAAMPPPPKPVSSFPTTKATSYVIPVHEDIRRQKTPTAPSQPELDFDDQDLKALKYEDLEHQAFDHDPRAPDAAPIVDRLGKTLTLEQSLENLLHSGMPDADARTFLTSQSTQEWVATGEWFMKKFESQMKQLMQVRNERRKAALRFEMEIKKRHAAVAAKTEDIREDLRELKEGSRQLMRNTASPRK